MHAPTVGHFAAVKRILRFVQGTLPYGLTFTPSTFDLHGFSDANWAGDIHDRKSTSGYCVFLETNLVSWSAKKQATVSRSSTKAEYRALAHTAAEFTKPLSVSRFQYLKNKLMITELMTKHNSTAVLASVVVLASASASAQPTLQPQLQKQATPSATVVRAVMDSTCVERYVSYI
ncbi:hypothetical protein CsSME_00038348 [Camellia sinensis var. sinensis]